MKRACGWLALLAWAPSAWADPPPTVLWAWERPEDLRGLPSSVGVAYFHSLATVSSSGVRVRPRMQPLRLDAATWRMPVVRIEVTRGTTPAHEARDVAALVGAVTTALGSAGAAGVQIDFDAPVSWRGVYRALLQGVRAAAGPRAWVSMTALASWCARDAWFAGAAGDVSEVVPMVFTMGRGGDEVLDRLRARGRFEVAPCTTSVGWAVGEPVVPLSPRPRTYVFNRAPWRAAEWARWVR